MTPLANKKFIYKSTKKTVSTTRQNSIRNLQLTRAHYSIIKYFRNPTHPGSQDVDHIGWGPTLKQHHHSKHLGTQNITFVKQSTTKTLRIWFVDTLSPPHPTPIQHAQVPAERAYKFTNFANIQSRQTQKLTPFTGLRTRNHRNSYAVQTHKLIKP